MTDEASTPTTETPETPEPTTPTAEAEGPKELREAYQREKERRIAAETQLLAGAFGDLGLDPSKGLGKAIAKEYEGEPTAEALAEYAEKEYGWERPETPENPQAPQIRQGEQRLQQVQGSSRSAEPQSETEALKKAEREGDFLTAGQIKAQRVAAMFRRQQGLQ